MIFGEDQGLARLKWAFDSCKNGAWGDEPDGETDTICIRAADFNGDLGSLSDGERTLRAIDEATYRKVGLRAGDLVVEKSGGGEKQLVGRAVIYGGSERAVCSNFLARCRPSESVTSAYLNYLLLAIYKGRGTYPHIKQTTGIQNLDMASFLNIKVKLPSLPNQKRIASFLNEKTAQIDGSIAKKQTLLDRLAEKRQAIITQAVTKGLGPAGPMKDSGVDWLGQIPAHWETFLIKRKYAVSYGVGGEIDRSLEIGTNLLSLPNISKDGRLVLEDVQFTENEDPSLLLEPGDLLFNWRNGSAEHLGKTALFDLSGKWTHVSFLLRIRAVEQNACTAFLRYFLNGMRETRFFASAKAGVNNTFNLFELQNLVVAAPPTKSEQESIADHIRSEVSKLDAASEILDASINRLIEYRSALITAAVTGQIEGLR